ncbi:MAG: Flp family type IVb pilin [Terracidiphilus sp.]|jgi:Flp pilus assembly pilin Flp
MNNLFLALLIKIQDLKVRTEGQDLVEYALAVSLIAFGAIAGMHTLARGLDTAFNQISSTLAASV